MKQLFNIHILVLFYRLLNSASASEKLSKQLMSLLPTKCHMVKLTRLMPNKDSFKISDQIRELHCM